MPVGASLAAWDHSARQSKETPMHEQQHANSPGMSRPWYRTGWGLALIGFAAIAALLLVYEHRIHIPFGNLLVILPLFACIGLHSLMHGGRGGHGGHGGRGSRPRDAAAGKAADDREAGQ